MKKCAKKPMKPIDHIYVISGDLYSDRSDLGAATSKHAAEDILKRLTNRFPDDSYSCDGGNTYTSDFRAMKVPLNNYHQIVKNWIKHKEMY